MPLSLDQMDPSLLNKTEMRAPFGSLGRARIQAQILGPNLQDNVAQAVQAREMVIESAVEDIEKIGYKDPYKLLSWISLAIGKADPNCGNYFTWSSLIVEGNHDVFKENKSLIEHTIENYNPNNQPIHPELTNILSNHQDTVHFTAIRIPEIHISENILVISWPGDLSNTVGNPPSEIPLKG